MDASRSSRKLCGYLMRLWNATAIALPEFSIILRILSSAVRLLAADATSTNDGGECWEEDLHSLSCSEDEDRGELVCTG